MDVILFFVNLVIMEELALVIKLLQVISHQSLWRPQGILMVVLLAQLECGQ